MRPRLSFGVIVLLLASCFALGLVSALLSRTPTEDPQPTQLPPPTEDQVDVVIVGYDHGDDNRAVLRSIWIASFEPPGRDLFLTGIPADSLSPDLDGRPLSTAFAITSDGAPSPQFLRALSGIAPMTPDLVVTLDEVGFTQIVDYLGGIDLNGAMLDGSQILAVLELLSEDPAASTATQRSVLQAMVERSEQLGDSPDITPLTGLVPDHAYVSLPMTQSIALVAPLLPLETSRVHFDVYGASSPDLSP
jgi:hypothetical protein